MVGLSSSGNIQNYQKYPHNLSTIKNKYYEKYDNSWEDHTEIDLNISAYMSKQFFLDSSSSLPINSINQDSDLLANFTNPNKDILGFPNELISTLQKSATGDFTINNFNNLLEISKSNASFRSGLTFNPFLALSGDEVLELELDEIDWIFNENDFAYSQLRFSFDTFAVTFVYASSESYNQYLINTTGQLKIINDLSSKINPSISELASLSNTSVPSVLRTIEWSVYLTRQYNFLLRFSSFSILTIPKTINFTALDKIFTTNHSQVISIPSDVSTEIRLVNNTSANISIRRTFRDKKVLIAHLDLEKGNLKFHASLNFSDYPRNYSYDLQLPDAFTEINIDSTLPNKLIRNETSNQVYLQDNVSVVLVFKAKFVEIPATGINIGEYYQGKLLNFDFNQDDPISGAFISNPDFTIIISANTSINSGNVLVPSNWSKGVFYLFLWYKNGYFSSIQQKLSLSPTKLASNDTLTLRPGIKTIYPIYIKNTTSNNIIKATKIISNYGGNLRSIDDSWGMIFEPGEFKTGNYSLFVTATKTGFVPVELILKIIVQEFHPTLSINVNRDTQTSAIINVIIDEFDRWTVSSYFSLTGEEINISRKIGINSFNILLNMSDWNSISSPDYEFTIILGNNIFSYSIMISIPIWVKQNENLIDSNLMSNNTSRNNKTNEISRIILIVLTTIISGSSIYILRRIKSNYNSERINF